jgi:polysaccharide biosynthesis transport protein
LKAQLADLTSHYTDKYPDVRKTKEQIALLETTRKRVLADLNSGVNNPTAEASAAASLDPRNATLLEMESQLKANRLEVANREAEIKDGQAKINQYQSRLNMAPVMEQQFAEITRDYDQSKTDYESLLAKKNQSEMSTNLEKTQQGERFRMLDPPNLPVRPYKPNRLLLSAAGLVVGLAFGGGLAFARENLSDKSTASARSRSWFPLR